MPGKAEMKAGGGRSENENGVAVQDADAGTTAGGVENEGKGWAGQGAHSTLLPLMSGRAQFRYCHDGASKCWEAHGKCK